MIYGDKEYKPGETKVPDLNAITQSSNLYAYCMNNPLKYTDLSGKSALAISAGLIVAKVIVEVIAPVAVITAHYAKKGI